MLDNTINKVAEEVLSPEKLEERQLKTQVSSDLKQKPSTFVVVKFCIWSFDKQILMNWTYHSYNIFLLFLTSLKQIINNYISPHWRWTMVDIYLAFLWLSWHPLIFTNTLVNNCFDIYHIETKTIGSFNCQYNEKWVEIDFVSLPAWQWIVLTDCFWTNESAHMKSTLHLCGIFWQVILVNIRFVMNCCVQKIKKAKLNLPLLLFHVNSLKLIRYFCFQVFLFFCF